MLVAFSIIPLTFAAGMGIDYSRAMKLQTKLNAAADAAALAAVTTPMMQKTDADAKQAAVNMFNMQAAGLSGLVYDPKSLSVTITSTTGVNTGRTATVSYIAQSSNSFSKILGKASLTIKGSASANATKAPFINFYLVMDTSPSMLLPSTSAGLTQMRSLTSTSYLSKGCAFACHTQNPHADKIYIRNPKGKDIWFDSSGTMYYVDKVTNGYVYSTNSKGQSVKIATESSGHYADSMWLAKNYGNQTIFPGGSNIELRLDAEQLAAQNLIPFAQTTAANNQVTYKLQMFSYDYGKPKTLTTSMVDVNTLTSASVPDLSNLQAYWYSNGYITSSQNIDDQSTDFQTMFNTMNTTIPTPGTGATKDSPQAVMFIITDGMSDESLNGSRTHRELQPFHLSQCQTIKNRGIRIAILYTEYLPDSLTGDDWSQNNVAPYIKNVEPALQQCASAKPDGTPLYYKVTTDQSISAALTALFALTVSTAHLVQ